MTVTCATCRTEVGDAATCPSCGTPVLSGSRPAPWRTDTAERAGPPMPVEPASATMPAPVRYPLYADELDVATRSESFGPPPAPLPPATLPPYYPPGDDDVSVGRSLAWLPWVGVALALVLVAAAGVWLLFSPGESDPAPDANPTLSVPDASDETEDPEPPGSEQPEAEAPSGDPVDVAASATAAAPNTAPPNADAFGNRTTYVAANMLDGRPDTCWRMPGDGTGVELTFQLASPTNLTRVGMVNGYAKNAVVGGGNLNWYVGNRRVLLAQWVFDDGTTVDQPLGATKQMQTLDLGTPVSTSTVKVRLLAVSAPGLGRSARNYTAISEVTLVGVPQA